MWQVQFNLLVNLQQIYFLVDFKSNVDWMKQITGRALGWKYVFTFKNLFGNLAIFLYFVFEFMFASSNSNTFIIIDRNIRSV